MRSAMCLAVAASCRNRQEAPRRGRAGAAKGSSPDLRLPLPAGLPYRMQLQRPALGGSEEAYPQSGCMSQATTLVRELAVTQSDHP